MFHICHDKTKTYCPGATSSHAMCVCTIHQKLILMINLYRLNLLTFNLYDGILYK